MRTTHSRELHPNRNKHMTIGNALALNANAVNLLSSNGNAQGAIKVLREALTALRQMLLVPFDTHPDNARESCKLRSVSVKLDDSTSSFQDDNSFHLFSRAILVEGCGQAMAPSDYLLNRISMAVTYNLGLAHHLLGTRDGNKQRRNYTKALTMYEVAYTLKKEYADNRDLMYLAVFNNMGHIYSHFWDKESIHRCLEGMHSVLMSCSSNEERACEEYDPFFMNVMMFYKKEAVATPAA
jgi:tetratricopeptide (TPR) repeat protein